MFFLRYCLRYFILLQIFFCLALCDQAWGKAAGIIPYYVNHKGEIFFLLGKDHHRHGLCDFGGTADGAESFEAAAIREGHEETSGLFSETSDDPANAAQYAKGIQFINDRINQQLKVERPSPGSYCIFFIDVTDKVNKFGGMDSTCQKFNTVRKNLISRGYLKNHHTFVEKEYVFWVSSNDLLMARSNGKHQKFGKHDYYEFPVGSGIWFYGYTLGTLVHFAPKNLGIIIWLIRNKLSLEQEMRINGHEYAVEPQCRYQKSKNRLVYQVMVKHAVELIAKVVCPADFQDNKAEITLRQNSDWWASAKKLSLCQKDIGASEWTFANEKEFFPIIKITPEVIKELKAKVHNPWMLPADTLEHYLNTYHSRNFIFNTSNDDAPFPTHIQAVLQAFFNVLLPLKNGRALVDVVVGEEEAKVVNPIQAPHVAHVPKSKADEEVKFLGPLTLEAKVVIDGDEYVAKMEKNDACRLYHGKKIIGDINYNISTAQGDINDFTANQKFSLEKKVGESEWFYTNKASAVSLPLTKITQEVVNEITWKNTILGIKIDSKNYLNTYQLKDVVGNRYILLSNQQQVILQAFFKVLLQWVNGQPLVDIVIPTPGPIVVGEVPKSPLDRLKDALAQLKARVVSLAQKLGLVRNKLGALKQNLEAIKK